MHFTYKARDSEGKIVKGEIESANESGAISSLRENGLFISSIAAKTESKFGKFDFFNKTSLKDKIIFTQQLGIMIKSGLSVVEAMKALAEETANKKFAAEINQIISDVKGGTQLSEALSKHPRTFDTVYINTVRSGEKSGKLEEVLARLAVQQEKDYELTSKVRGALIYPTFVLVALIVVFVLVLIGVIPELKKIFDEMDVPLPAVTRAIIALSDFMKNNIVLMLIIIAAIVVALKYFGKSTTGRRIFDQLKMKIPVLGSLTKKSYMAKFCRTFAGLSAAGLPLLDIFRTSKEVINNVIYQEAIEDMSKRVENGEPISRVLKECRLFPAMVGQLASVGEKSGSIDTVFDTLANFFDREVDNITANLSQMLEPVLMVVMGVGIGVLIISVVQPIYGLVNVI